MPSRSEIDAQRALNAPSRPNDLDKLPISDREAIKAWWVSTWHTEAAPPENAHRRQEWWKDRKRLHARLIKAARGRHMLRCDPNVAASMLVSASAIPGLSPAGAAAVAAMQADGTPTSSALVPTEERVDEVVSLTADHGYVLFRGLKVSDKWVLRNIDNITDLKFDRPVATASGRHAIRRLSAKVRSPNGKQHEVEDEVTYLLPQEGDGQATQQKLYALHRGREISALKRMSIGYRVSAVRAEVKKAMVATVAAAASLPHATTSSRKRNAKPEHHHPDMPAGSRVKLEEQPPPMPLDAVVKLEFE